MVEQLVWKGTKESGVLIIDYFKECFEVSEDGTLIWKHNVRKVIFKEKKIGRDITIK